MTQNQLGLSELGQELLELGLKLSELKCSDQKRSDVELKRLDLGPDVKALTQIGLK